MVNHVLDSILHKAKKVKQGKKGKKGVALAFFLSLCVILNLDYMEEKGRMLLTNGDLRYLSKNLGGGKCEWLAPEPLNETEPVNTTTLLASYPGSGKRLTWRLLEALTGSITGDDWDLSENGFDVLTLKTSWPHPEGVWTWGDKMDQLVLLVRNPRFAIPSYHTMRYELNFSTNWTQSYSRKNFTYTERPSIIAWENWRDNRFGKEMDRWVWYIDFWMQGGLRRNSKEGIPKLDWHCDDGLMDCTPKSVVQFEKLYSADRGIGRVESRKIGDVLDSAEDVNVIAQEARDCVYDEVMNRAEFHNANRDGNGPGADEKTFRYQQLDSMALQVETLRDKYAGTNWTDVPIAQDLVIVLNEYIADIVAEYEIEKDEYYASLPAPE